MATKDELVAFAEAHGVDVDASWLKADIEAALTDAGYDPTNVGVEPMATDPEEAERTSSDASYSTYVRLDQQEIEATWAEGENPLPAPGPQTVQQRGVATEGGGTTFSADR